MMLPDTFNYHSREWGLMKEALLKDYETAVGELINPATDPETTQQLRGRLLYIKQILDGERAAELRRLRGGN